jgi:hypothetical protein
MILVISAELWTGFTPEESVFQTSVGRRWGSEGRIHRALLG